MNSSYLLPEELLEEGESVQISSTSLEDILSSTAVAVTISQEALPF